MRKNSLKILSTLMAFVVVFTTLSFTVDMHFCGDTLVDTSIFQKVKGCRMELQKSSDQDGVIKSNNCCNDMQLVIDGQDELQISITSFAFEQPLFIYSLLTNEDRLTKILDKSVLRLEDYLLQLVIRQLYKIDETYLI